MGGCSVACVAAGQMHPAAEHVCVAEALHAKAGTFLAKHVHTEHLCVQWQLASRVGPCSTDAARQKQKHWWLLHMYGVVCTSRYRNELCPS